MSKDIFKKSIFFVDADGEKRFLFKVVNYGKKSDELKFIFIHPNSGNPIIHNQEGKKYPDESIIRYYGELSYHSDGSLLWKLPQTQEGHKKIIDNPHGTGTRRTAISAIEKWEPVVVGNIIRYKNCRNELTNDAEVLEIKPNIFNGDPFEYFIFLGHMKYMSPPNNGSNELIHRVNNVAQNVDMIVWVRKSNYFGEPFEFAGKQAVNNNNRVRIAEPRLQIDDSGVVEIDLKILWNASWDTSIVNNNKMLNVRALRNLPPMTKVGKAYLKDNPYLNQLMDLVGMNKGFAISPLFNGKKLGVRLAGILDKDERGNFFGFGTGPEE